MYYTLYCIADTDRDTRILTYTCIKINILRGTDYVGFLSMLTTRCVVVVIF